jgi:hypothetical protein
MNVGLGVLATLGPYGTVARYGYWQATVYVFPDELHMSGLANTHAHTHTHTHTHTHNLRRVHYVDKKNAICPGGNAVFVPIVHHQNDRREDQ